MRTCSLLLAVGLGVLSGEIGAACTAVCASSKGKVLVGNNEDFGNPRSRIWFVPAGNVQYGRLLVGFDSGNTQGGMNEKGLMFDGFATPTIDLPPSPDKQIWMGGLGEKALAECGTVEEVVRLLDRYYRGDRVVIFFADASGDAVAVEPAALVRKKDWFFVQTNFCQSRIPAASATCERFRIARRLLEESKGDINVDLFRRILAATHQEGGAPTQYSNIYDLRARTMYLYHFHNFENVVRIDLAEELRRGAHKMDIPALFPRTYAAETHERWYESQQNK
jgi:penicillin V acylase-like amidase (Ntn superfamily)